MIRRTCGHLSLRQRAGRGAMPVRTPMLHWHRSLPLTRSRNRRGNAVLLASACSTTSRERDASAFACDRPSSVENM
jgi:hypothetical protein